MVLKRFIARNLVYETLLLASLHTKSICWSVISKTANTDVYLKGIMINWVKYCWIGFFRNKSSSISNLIDVRNMMVEYTVLMSFVSSATYCSWFVLYSCQTSHRSSRFSMFRCKITEIFFLKVTIIPAIHWLTFPQHTFLTISTPYVIPKTIQACNVLHSFSLFWAIG